MTTVTKKESRDEHHGHRPARRAPRAEALGHAGNLGRPPRPGPRRRARTPGIPPDALPGRDHPPRHRRVPTPPAPGEVRAAGHPGGVRFLGLAETPGSPDPRPG